MKHIFVGTLFILGICIFGSGQTNSAQPTAIHPEIKAIISPDAPKVTSRTIIQDKNGHIWIAAFNGVFKYDGKSFTNIAGHLTSYRFSSVLEDRQGNFWFATMGAGAYHYDGNSFEHYTTKEGLLNDEIQFMYKDKGGDVWFGVNGGVSRYNGKTFRNYVLNGNSITEDTTGRSFGFTRPSHEVTSIIEDRRGRIWLGTRDHSFVYDGETFTSLVHNNEPLTNIRTLIESRNGDIWLGGQHGLWRYDGVSYHKVAEDPVLYIFEDSDGNIWKSSQSNYGASRWTLSRYDSRSLSDVKAIATEILSRPIIWGIFQDNDGSMWIAADGVLRYDGKSVVHYKNSEDH